MQNNSSLIPELQNYRLSFFQILIVIWSLTNILFGGILITEGLYINHILVVLLFIAAVLVKPKIFSYKVFWLIVMIMLIFSIGSYLVNGLTNPRFLQEHLKLLLILIGSLAICNSMNWKIANILMSLLPIIIFIQALVVYLLDLGYYYGNSMNFGIPIFGGPNTTGFVLSLALCATMYNIFDSKKSPIFRIYSVLLFLGLFLILYNTYSAAAFICSLFVFLRYFGLKLNYIFYISFFILLTSLFLIWSGSIVIPELFGTGRVFIWALLLSDFIFSSPINWIFGFGPGGVNIEPDFTKIVQSAHSTYIEVLYSYGLLGLSLLIWLINLVYKKIKKQFIPLNEKKLIDSIFLVVFLSFLFDTHILTAQVLWIGALIIGVSISRISFFKDINESRL